MLGTRPLQAASCEQVKLDRAQRKKRLDFSLLGWKITADGDCSLEIRRHLLLGREAMTNLDSVLRRKHITSLAKLCIINAMVFPVVMYGCESWTIKKAEHQRTDEPWCWRRLLRVAWIARRSNQTILKEINLEYYWKD